MRLKISDSSTSLGMLLFSITSGEICCNAPKMPLDFHMPETGIEIAEPVKWREKVSGLEACRFSIGRYLIVAGPLNTIVSLARR